MAGLKHFHAVYLQSVTPCVKVSGPPGCYHREVTNVSGDLLCTLKGIKAVTCMFTETKNTTEQSNLSGIAALSTQGYEIQYGVYV